MKTFMSWLKDLTSQQRNQKIKTLKDRYNDLYWVAHPSLYVSIWMRADFFRMQPEEFVAKYLLEMEDDSTSEARRDWISSVILPMYKHLTGRDYNMNIKELVQ